VLWDRTKLANDADVEDTASGGFGSVTHAHNVRTPAEVDHILAQAAAAGATITKKAETTVYGGYAGYFADPDSHLWEIARNPGFSLGPEGELILPDFHADQA
jgi:uncharacterized protein